jgi:hypothetical protein
LLDDSEQVFEIFELERVRAVTQSMLGVLVNLHKKRINARRNAGARERGNKLSLPAGSITEASRQLK